MKSQSGFTLLELLIAFSILTVVLASVYLTQSSSLFSSVRTKNVLIATNLARNMMAEAEIKLTGVKFDDLPKEQEGEFDDNNKDFKWKRTIEEVDFSSLADIVTAAEKTQEKQDNSNSSQDQMIAKYFQDYLGKSVRRMILTISWPEGTGSSSVSFTMLLVNYDADFATAL